MRPIRNMNLQASRLGARRERTVLAHHCMEPIGFRTRFPQFPMKTTSRWKNISNRQLSVILSRKRPTTGGHVGTRPRKRRSICDDGSKLKIAEQGPQDALLALGTTKNGDSFVGNAKNIFLSNFRVFKPHLNPLLSSGNHVINAPPTGPSHRGKSLI